MKALYRKDMEECGKDGYIEIELILEDNIVIAIEELAKLENVTVDEIVERAIHHMIERSEETDI